MQYHHAIERFYAFSDANLSPLLDTLANGLPDNANENFVAAMARSLGNSFVSPLQSPQLLIDVSYFMGSGATQPFNTQWLRSMLHSWLCAFVPGVLIELIYFANGHHYYARQFATQLIGCPDVLPDEPIQSAPGDVYLSLGLDNPTAESASDAKGVCQKSPELDWFSLQGNRMLGLDVRHAQFVDLMGTDTKAFFVQGLEPLFWASLGEEGLASEKMAQIWRDGLLQLLSVLGLGAHHEAIKKLSRKPVLA
jgi:hypothetical protein